MRDHVKIIRGMRDDKAFSSFGQDRAKEAIKEVEARFREELEREHGKGWRNHITEDRFRQFAKEVIEQDKEYKKRHPTSKGDSFHRHSINAFDKFLNPDKVRVVRVGRNTDQTRTDAIQVNAANVATNANKAEIEEEQTAKTEAETGADAEKAEIKENEAAETEAETGKEKEEAETDADKEAEKEAKEREKAEKAQEKADKAAQKAQTRRGRLWNFLTREKPQKEKQPKETAPRQPRATVTRSLDESSGFALFLMLLTMALAVVDYWFLHFGGLDYNIYLNAWKGGGLSLLFMTFVPIYTLAGILIIELVFVARKHNAAYFLLAIFGSLLAAKAIMVSLGMNIVPGIGLSISVVALVAAMLFSMWKLMDDDTRGHFLSWVFYGLIWSAILSLGGIMSIGSIAHLIIAFLVWLFVIGERDVTSANYWVGALLILDFFGFGIIKAMIPMATGSAIIANRFVFPIWFFFISIYSLEFKKSKLIKFIVFCVIIFYILALVDGVYGWTNINAQIQANPDEVAEAKSFFKNAFKNMMDFPDKVVAEYRKGLEQATGGYYQGRVEENQDPRNDLGVHLVNLQAADKEFYQNEEVIVWGDLKAKTLEDPISIFMSCEAGEAEGVIKPEKLAQINIADRHIIQQLEQIPFECRFAPDELQAGTTSVKIKAEFNFNTLGYLKTYFMDIERMRALRRENVDPLRQYGIDKVSDAIYTNGPVKLGMGTVDPPLGLSTNSDAYSYIGVTVQPQWFGRIKNITSVQIQVPVGLDISDPTATGDTTYCRKGFKMTDPNKEGYSIYDMEEGEIKKTKVPITTYKSWRCPIKITSTTTPDILGNIPVATHHFRAEVGYIYEIEKSTNVFVKGAEGEERRLSGCEITCDDDDGCVCPADCGVPAGTTIGKGYTCNNAPIGSNTLIGSADSFSILDKAMSEITVKVTLNEVCAGIPGAKEALEAQGKGNDAEAIIQACGIDENKIDKIEETEKEIVEQIENSLVVTAITMEGKALSADNRDTLNSKLQESITILIKTRDSFEKIYLQDNIPADVIYEDYRGRINTAQFKLNALIVDS